MEEPKILPYYSDSFSLSKLRLNRVSSSKTVNTAVDADSATIVYQMSSAPTNSVRRKTNMTGVTSVWLAAMIIDDRPSPNPVKTEEVYILNPNRINVTACTFICQGWRYRCCEEGQSSIRQPGRRTVQEHVLPHP